MAFTGCIRGAIAFGLSMGIKTSYLNSLILTHATLILIFLTTIIFGAIMPFVFSYYRAKDTQPEQLKRLAPDEYDYELLRRYESQEPEIKFASTGTYDYDFSHPNNKLLE
jgi:hypothetical protein